MGGGGANLICGETGYHTAFPKKEKSRWYHTVHKKRVGEKKRSCS